MNGLPETFGKGIIAAGIILVVVGVLVLFGQKIPFLGKLPGDIYIKKENVTFYFPVATCIVISVIIYFAVRLFQK